MRVLVQDYGTGQHFELASESQFVLITHNKRTIEIADVLYGVTMERKGISTIVSVEMHAEREQAPA